MTEPEVRAAIAAVVEYYPADIIARLKIADEAKPIIRRIIASSLFTGMNCAANILAQEDGSSEITAQTLVRIVDEIATGDGKVSERLRLAPAAPNRN